MKFEWRHNNFQSRKMQLNAVCNISAILLRPQLLKPWMQPFMFWISDYMVTGKQGPPLVGHFGYVIFHLGYVIRCYMSSCDVCTNNILQGWFTSTGAIIGWHQCSCSNPQHRENSPVTQTSPEPTLLSWSYRANWATQTLLFSKPLDLAQVCHGNKICSKPALTWKLTLVLAFPAHCISN